MADCLDIDPDTADDLVADIERRFGIKLQARDLESCYTLGDLHQVVLGELRCVERAEGLPCPSAMAFRRLRRAIVSRRPELEIRPSTLLSEFISERDVRKWFRYLADQAGLDLPRTEIAPRAYVWSGVAAAALVALSVASFIALDARLGWYCAIAAPCAALVLLKAGPRRPSRTHATVGGLARAVALENIGALTRRHGAVRVRDVWAAFEDVVQRHSGRTGPVAPETRFYKPAN